MGPVVCVPPSLSDEVLHRYVLSFPVLRGLGLAHTGFWHSWRQEGQVRLVELPIRPRALSSRLPSLSMYRHSTHTCKMDIQIHQKGRKNVGIV